MKAPSIIRYPGGKSKLAELIAGKLEPHVSPETIYVEPFFGGGSVGLAVLAAYGERMKGAVINDFNPAVAALWTAVIRQPENLKRKVLEFEPAVEAFYRFKENLLGSNSMLDGEDGVLELGFQKLAIHRISYSGLGEMSGSPLGGRWQRSDCKIGSRWNPMRLCEAIDHAHQILTDAGVEKCHCLSFADILKGLSRDAIVYLDPPYVEQGGACYKLAFGEDDHDELARILETGCFTWLLSYDDCPEIRSRYQGQPIEVLPVRNTMRHVKLKDGTVVAKEQSELLIGPTLPADATASRRAA